MAVHRGRAPRGAETKKPSIARVYDYFLGGRDNFPVDREAAGIAMRLDPSGEDAAVVNRAFVERAVHHLAAEFGMRQFLDIGCGLPAKSSVHGIAQTVAPETKVVYVDNDPMVLAHARAVLLRPGTRIVEGDLRRAAEIVRHPVVREFLDFEQPIAVLLASVLHHLRDEEDPAGAAAVIRDALPSGSILLISHFADPGPAQPKVSEHVRTLEKMFNQRMGTGRWRTREEIEAYFGDFEPIEPGLVPLPEWRPGPEGPEPCSEISYHSLLGGAARKP